MVEPVTWVGWFRRLLSRNNPVSGKDFGTTVQLPNELLDNILGRLETGYLMTCRHVNFQWKEVAEKVLGDRVSAKFTKWNMDEDVDHWDLGIPTVSGPIGAPSHDHYYEICMRMYYFSRRHVQYRPISRYEELGRHLQRTSGNPFPSNSLRIVVQGRSIKRQEMEAGSFFNTFGHHLIHFILVEYRATAEEFIRFLSNFPNLQSLTLQNVRISCNDGNQNLLDIPLLNHLTHLRMFTLLDGGDWFTLSFDWLLERFASQLVGLVIYGTIYVPFNTDGTISKIEGKGFQLKKLKQLKINYSNMMVLKVIESATLAQIHIMSDIAEQGIRYSPVLWECMNAKLLELMQVFSTSLRELIMTNIICNIFNSSYPLTVLPEVEIFRIRAPLNAEDVMTLKTFFLPAFPAVKQVEFILVRRHYDGLVSNTKKEKYWQACPKLQILSLFDSVLWFHDCRSDAERTSVIWRKNKNCAR